MADKNENEFDQQIDDIAAAISGSRGGEEVDREVLKSCALETNKLQVTQKWEARCLPYVQWLREQPPLAWFVSSANVAKLGVNTHMRLKAMGMDMSDLRSLEIMNATWYNILTVFAKDHGCPLEIVRYTLFQ